MTVAILRRLLQILVFLAAVALVLALARALPTVTPDVFAEPAVNDMLAQPGTGTHVVPASLQWRPSVRAWQSAGLALGASCIVIVPATLIALALGTVLGSVAGRARGPVVGSTIAVASAVALAIPVFLVARAVVTAVPPLPDTALALIAGQASGASWRALATSPTMLACVAMVALALLPGVVDTTRTQVRAALTAAWMKSARAQGIPHRRIVVAFVRPIVIAAAASVLPRALAVSLSVACVVENVLGWPGIGHALVASIIARDPGLGLACVVMLAALLCLLALGGVALRCALDPRHARSA